PTNCATEARSLNEVATLRSARAGIASDAANAISAVMRVSWCMDCLRESKARRAGGSTESIGVSGVVADRVAHLHAHAVVAGMDPRVGLRVAVLEPDERDLAGGPPQIDRSARHRGRHRIAGRVDDEVGEAPARLLAAHADPPGLRQPVLERGVA